jgi:hypothetical protein
VLQFDHLPEGTRLCLAQVAAGLSLDDVGVRVNASLPCQSKFKRASGANRCRGKRAGRAPA